MYYLYLDESGETGIDYQNKEQPYFCISGIIVKEENLNNLEADIRGLKKSIRVPDDHEIHTSHIRDYNRLSLLYKNLWPIIKNNYVGIVNTGFLKAELNSMLAYDGKRLLRFKDSPKKIIPYIYGAYLTLLKFNHFLKVKHSLGKVIFDEKAQAAQVKKIFNKFSNKELLGPPISWDMISIEYLDSKQSTFIQLADVVAYTINKANIFQDYPQDCLGYWEAIITDAFSVIQKYSIPSLEFDVGAILPAIVSNDMLAKISSLILKEKR